MFDALTDRFDGIFTRLRSRGKLTEADIDAVAREIRLALLEADVNVKVVKALVGPGEGTRERRGGAEEPQPRATGDQDRPRGADRHPRWRVRQAHHEPEAADGRDDVRSARRRQDDGRGQARRANSRVKASACLLVAADLQRPAAVEQLRVLGQRVDVPVWAAAADAAQDAVEVARTSLEEAARLGRNVVIVDTAGRLQIDTELMLELRQVRDAVNPTNTLLVVDAMTGQEAVNVRDRVRRCGGPRWCGAHQDRR